MGESANTDRFAGALRAHRRRGAGWIAAACLAVGLLHLVTWFGDWRGLVPIEKLEVPEWVRGVRHYLPAPIDYCAYNIYSTLGKVRERPPPCY